MRHLLEFFDRYVKGRSDALRYDDGFRRWSYSGDQLREASERFAGRLMAAGLQTGDRVVIWSGNRPEWVAVFWGCLLRGVTVIPVDPGASNDLLQRIVKVAAPRGIVLGDDTHVPANLPVAFTWRLNDVVWAGSESRHWPRTVVGPDTIAEIVFTSGTTGDPKGVVITHRNILANITPVERAVAHYSRFIWVLRPIRFLGLLPLSHMFGQALTIFLPRLVDASTVFIKGHHPGDIARQIRRHRITLAVMIPRALDMMRSRLQRHVPHCAEPAPTPLPLVKRLWRYRDAHRLFGWKFCGFVVGGAHLDRELEEYWRRLGFAVIQGYGLTETAPIVAWNEPFRMRHGTVGKPLEGVEVQIAGDGEVLVRGPAVTAGYLDAPEETKAAFQGGWFHTGDIGAFDADGHLLIKGRKKDEIVTAEGIHVFPEDVERVLEVVPGVRETAVVAKKNGGEQVHAVLVLESGADAATIVRQANSKLENHQRINSFSVWPQPALPRTDALRKIKRGEVQRWVATGSDQVTSPLPLGDLDQLLARYAHGRAISEPTTLDELGLKSLDRIELTMALEERTGEGVNESAVAACRTVGDLRQLIDAAANAEPAQAEFTFPRWATNRLAAAVRNVSQQTWILPLARVFLRLRTDGLEHLDALRGPVIFAANHQSHFDTPAILLSLPARWRRRMAVAMAREFFDARFFPKRHGLLERIGNAALYALATLFFNAFPLPRSGPGARDTLRYAGELASEGWSILIFPEGHRTQRGEITTFQPGVGMIASRLRMPVCPVRLEGVDRVLHQSWHWPRRGSVRVIFGSPLTLQGEEYSSLARRVEEAVVALIPAADHDQVTEASEESFPASDPPSWTTSSASISART
jgi:long-chain acyl-CoA synthetase